MSRYDLFVIGAGSGGVRAARIAGALGARVGICEERRLGGTCVNLGCVPKKLLVYAADYRRSFEDAAGFGWSVGESRHSWADLIAAKDQEIARLNGIYGRIMEKVGVEIHRGRGVITGPNTVEVNGISHHADHILIATGGRPVIPPGMGHGITSDEAFSLPELPGRILIVGGGYIGVEFACIFAGLGVEVTLVHRHNVVLNRFDREIAQFLTTEIAKHGITLQLESQVDSVEAHDGCQRVQLSGASTTSIDTDLVMWCTGRVPNTRGLGLESVGIPTDARGAIAVDETWRTRQANIYACGDVIDRIALTPVALAEGMQIARNLFGPHSPAGLDYHNIATAVFSNPNVGTVGLTEEEAHDRGHEVVIFRSEFRPMLHTLSGRNQRTLMKLVVDRQTDKVLGCHMVGPEAGEIIQGLAVALNAGATKAVFDRTIGIHPTAAEEFVTMRTPAR